MESIIVFSHLRWNFVYQRPQHLMSRLAAHYRVVFFEEPGPPPNPALSLKPAIRASGEPPPAVSPPMTASKTSKVAAPSDLSAPEQQADTPSSPVTWQTEQPLPQLTVLRPVLAPGARGFHQADIQALSDRLRALRRLHPRHIAWFYTPMALPLLEALDPAAIVYDCMDELSAFLDPPPGLLEHERKLLEMADLVFTGGPSLYEAKRSLRSNVHCFPSSVDAAHFRQALDRNLSHPCAREIPSPRLGFFGVLDERFDTVLVATIAEQRPDWQIVLVGPVVKIDPATLPRRPNIHYLGQQPYEALPPLLASWDVCLMPFAINDATRFISPTKSLEYMAAELPVVSTPVCDVVNLHRDVVDIASTPEEFIDCCDRALAASPQQRQQRIRAMRRKLAGTSWDSTASAMRALLDEQLGMMRTAGFAPG